jgi:hypothetical protein
VTAIHVFASIDNKTDTHTFGHHALEPPIPSNVCAGDEEMVAMVPSAGVILSPRVAIESRSDLSCRFILQEGANQAVITKWGRSRKVPVLQLSM